MPWSAQTFKSRHNHQLSPHAAAVAAKIANHVLESGKSDASAIRIANAAVPKQRGKR